jgi:LSD1 subclass zinc finger protein
MPSECGSIQTIVSTLLGKGEPEFKEPSAADVESAFRHLKRCASCRSSLSAEDRAKFIRCAILERE